MKIFSPQKTTAEPTTKNADASGAKTARAAKKEALPAKKNMSPDEIKEKLAAHVDTSQASKNMAVMNSKKFGEGFLNDDVKPKALTAPLAPDPSAPQLEAPSKEESPVEEKSANSKDFVLKSDIALNDPKDTNTQEKLKTVLAKGAFSFNAREKEALEKILGN